MAYTLDIARRAERDLGGIYQQIDAEDSDAAFEWYLGLKTAILSLEKLPNRCPAVKENVRLRQLLYGQKPHIYRVIFRVIERHKRVEVLHIRHGARRAFNPSELA